MGGSRNSDRDARVRDIFRLADKYAVASVPPGKAANSSRQRVVQVLADLDKLDLVSEDLEGLAQARAGYWATFPGHDKPENQPPPRQEEGQGGAANVGGKTWKFQAVQLTYNATTAEWASTDEVALQALFCRFNALLRQVADSLEAVGLSTTMERGASSDHVHCHAYMHLSKAFHRRGRGALEVFRFEGIAPHVQPNTASGRTYIGAVRHGHFYVVVEKIGSLRLGLRSRGLGESAGLKFCGKQEAGDFILLVL